MKVTLNLRNLLIGTLIILMGYFSVKFYQEWSDRSAVSDQLNLILKKQEMDRINLIKKLEKDSTDFVSKIDSSKQAFNDLENKRISDNNYYQNKLHALKKINTYSARQHYADSLIRAIVR